MNRLVILPDRTDSAVMNMAVDLALLECSLQPGVLLFRHYGWSEPAYTYGVSQSRELARMVAGPEAALVRRATGGGVVSHLNDWTYALLAPAGHALAEMKATASYHLVHEAVAAALAEAGVPAGLVPCPRESCATHAAPLPARKPGACFLEPEIYDVVRADSGAKISGAAQKRTRAGILFQGYIEKSACPGLDWTAFARRFTAALARAGEARCEYADALPVDGSACARAEALFTSAEWNNRR